MASTKRTLGIDLGTNSLGWAIIATDGEPCGHPDGRVIDSGVRIFSQAEMAGRDPQSKASLAVARREARGARRRRDRYLKRRTRLLDQLTQYGLMPAAANERHKLVNQTSDKAGDDQSASVYALRARSLDTSLTPHELGRAIFHLNQRRGFKSNRKTDANDAEIGKIATAVTALEEQMIDANARTFGEWLYMRRQMGLSVRARMDEDGQGYAFYPSRAALEHEFDAIMSAQRRFQADLLNDSMIAELRETLFFQRPLRPVLPGKCSYPPHNDDRLPKADPRFQRFRLLKEVNELEIVGEDLQHIKLTPDQRNALVLALRTKLNKQGKIPFSKLKTVLKLGKEVRFNKESDNRKDLEGDVIYHSLSQPEAFGNRWASLSLEGKVEVTEKLRTGEDHKKLVDWLIGKFKVDKASADAIAGVHVPDGYGRLGETALTTLADYLENETENGFVITEAAASKKAYGLTNSETDPNRLGVTELPKYQEVLERHIPLGMGGDAKPEDPQWDLERGRITNPTVHIALNQLRRVINALIRKHGKPDHIAIEVGRDLKLNEKQRDEVNRTIGKNTREAIARGSQLTEVHKQRDTGYNRLRLKLWEELNTEQPLGRVCVYCGTAIAAHMLFNGETDVDHILPYSKTLDDSQGNKLLCCMPCNRAKGNRAPADVAGWAKHYDDILARVTVLPKNKQWRFARNAMERFGDEAGFLARQLTDMQYISRLALTYLGHLYDAEEPDMDGVYRRHSRVRALPGRMTEMLRRKWSLNELLPDHNHVEGGATKPKNRLDHRHHAIDAIVIACTTRSLIQKLSTEAARGEEAGAERLLADVEVPWPTFREDVRDAVGRIVVSHKPDHGSVSRAGYAKGRGQTAGKLHNDTAYGLTGEKDEKGNDIVVRRVSISGITKPSEILKIRGNEHGHSELRDRLWEATRDLEGKAFMEAVERFRKQDAKFKGIRHVRVVEPLKTIAIRNKAGKAYKGYKGDSNDRVEVWRLLDGSWDYDVVSTFDAHQPGWSSKIRDEHPTACKIMSLRQGDCIVFEKDATLHLARVSQLWTNGQITLVPLNEAGNLDARRKSKTDPFKLFSPNVRTLKKLKGRQVRIDEIGQVFDPGPWWMKPE